ncbi:hypothetical protein HZD82_23805, partial [Pantoea agglomerans]|uniref:hypothetical protein n=1 Tax=Enterobacter agglomerans TaxID=549 RepID=UPI001A8BFD2B
LVGQRQMLTESGQQIFKPGGFNRINNTKQQANQHGRRDNPVIGGMAGCAMIGQSVINVKSGGRGRLSTLTAGVVLLLMVV